MAHSLSAISGVEEKPLKAPFDSACISDCVIVDARSLSECASVCVCLCLSVYKCLCSHPRKKSHSGAQRLSCMLKRCRPSDTRCKTRSALFILILPGLFITLRQRGDTLKFIMMNLQLCAKKTVDCSEEVTICSSEIQIEVEILGGTAPPNTA